mmetsp:Transcript_100729/g.260215  ORF Transcript_100729/g.260215 Transcript_100729/m.260215 type:complete len:90 (+) Transcript_100729:418-687(+)
MTWPLETTQILWLFLTVLRRCAMMMTVMLPAVIIPSMADCTCRSDSASRALVASSRSRIFGCLTSARAMAMRCFWPPDSCTPRSPTSVA